MENTGNMFLMLAGIVQRTPGESRDWLQPFMPMLTSWAEYLVASLPFPANQLCTDDFVILVHCRQFVVCLFVCLCHNIFFVSHCLLLYY